MLHDYHLKTEVLKLKKTYHKSNKNKVVFDFHTKYLINITLLIAKKATEAEDGSGNQAIGHLVTFWKL
jgi:hypothetical protein